MDNCLRMLQPSAYTFGLVGTTGSGKTQLVCGMTEPGARKILMRGVGKTNTTIRNWLTVFSADPELDGRIIVGVKPEPVFFGSRDLMELLRDPLSETVRQLGRKGQSDAPAAEDCLREKLKDLVESEDFGLRRLLALLTAEQRQGLMDGILQWFLDSAFYQYIEELYGRAVTELRSRGEDPSKNSAKLKSELRMQVETRMDLLTQSGGTRALIELCRQTEQALRELFFRVFPEENRSVDGYYFLDISLETPDMAAVEMIFSNHTKGNPSLESLCREIVVYAPLEEHIRRRLEQYPQFKDSRGHSCFALLDTRGLFHGGLSEEENEEYCSDLLYRSKIDALILLRPLETDANDKKAQLLYHKTLKGFKRDIPVFPVFNKADRWVDEKLKDLEDEGEELPESGQLQAMISDRVRELTEGLADGLVWTQQWKRPQVCYLKGERSFQPYPELQSRYALSAVLDMCFAQMSQALRQRDGRFPMKLENWEDEPTPEVDRCKLADIVKEFVALPETDRKVFTPARLNLSENRWKVPHGNSYNALRRRLAQGGGWSSNITESYYYYCQNIQVNYPANLQNFVTPELTRRLAAEALSIRDGSFLSEEDRAAYQSEVAEEISPQRFASQLLYDRALMAAERQPGSFGAWFQKFVENSADYLEKPLRGQNDYEEVLSELLVDAAGRVLRRKVRYVTEE